MLAIVAALLVAASPQAVPEGIYKLAQGPSTICGIKANGAAEFRTKVDAEAAAGRLVRKDGGSRFDFYMTPDGQWPIRQWAFSKSGESAYPMATCRDVYQDEAGSIFQGRQMRCDASRTACDAVFVEFADLDKRVAAELRGK